jgi:hypothetical protein
MFDLLLVVDFRLFRVYVVLFLNLSFWVGFHLYFSTVVIVDFRSSCIPPLFVELLPWLLAIANKVSRLAAIVASITLLRCIELFNRFR